MKPAILRVLVVMIMFAFGIAKVDPIGFRKTYVSKAVFQNMFMISSEKFYLLSLLLVLCAVIEQD